MYQPSLALEFLVADRLATLQEAAQREHIGTRPESSSSFLAFLQAAFSRVSLHRRSHPQAQVTGG